MLIAGAAAISNTAVAQDTKVKVEVEQDDRTELRISEVPSPISTTITNDYGDWKTTKVYKMKDPATQQHVYEVHLSNADGAMETKRFSAEGEEIEIDD